MSTVVEELTNLWIEASHTYTLFHPGLAGQQDQENQNEQQNKYFILDCGQCANIMVDGYRCERIKQFRERS